MGRVPWDEYLLSEVACELGLQLVGKLALWDDQRLSFGVLGLAEHRRGAVCTASAVHFFVVFPLGSWDSRPVKQHVRGISMYNQKVLSGSVVLFALPPFIAIDSFQVGYVVL